MASDNQAEFGKRLAKVMKKMKDQSAKYDAERRANYVPAEEQQGVVNPDPDATPSYAKPAVPDQLQDPTEYTADEWMQRQQRMKKGLRHKANKDGTWTTTRGGKPVK